MMKRTAGSVECTTPMPTIEAGPSSMLVFQNLVENALKYFPPGRASRGRCRRRLSSVGCSVAAMGARDVTRPAANAFEAFKQFDWQSEGLGMGMGMGMGLCHVQQIIEAHGGSIWVESVLGEGTTMAFTLPEVQLS